MFVSEHHNNVSVQCQYCMAIQPHKELQIRFRKENAFKLCLLNMLHPFLDRKWSVLHPCYRYPKRVSVFCIYKTCIYIYIHTYSASSPSNQWTPTICIITRSVSKLAYTISLIVSQMTEQLQFEHIYIYVYSMHSLDNSVCRQTAAIWTYLCI